MICRGRCSLFFLLGVLDVIRVGLAAGEKLLDVFGASKPDWNAVVDVLNAVQEQRAVRKKKYLWSDVQNIFVASSGHSAGLFQDEGHRGSFVQVSQLKKTIER